MTEATTSSDLASRLAQLESSHLEASLLAESTIHDLNHTILSLRNELSQCRASVQEVELREQASKAEKEALKEEISRLQQGATGSSEKEQQWKKEKDTLESEKRELLDVVERKDEENKTLQESLTSLRSLHTSLQSSNSDLESSLLESTNSARSSLLKIQSLQSNITSLESDKQFLSTELERLRSEYSNHRRTTHASSLELNQQLSNTKNELDSLKITNQSLQASYTTLQERHQETMVSYSSIKQEKEANESSFVLEISGMKRLVERMEAREEERKQRIDQIESSLEHEGAQLAKREEELLEDLEKERQRCDEYENKVTELKNALERSGEDGSIGSPGRFALSPSAQLAARGQKAGRSYAQVYAEYIRMEEQLVAERAESKRLSDCLTQILADIEERAPLMKEQRIEYERLSQEATQLATRLAEASSRRDEADRRANSAQLNIDRLERENSMLDAQLRDLGRQVRSLARQNAYATGVVTNGSPEDDDEEEAEIVRRAEIDQSTDAIVSAHLVTFKSINELQVQNQKLLRITREMGDQMERADDDAQGRRRWQENQAVEEAHELILKLKQEIESQQVKIEAFARERDMFRRMLATQTGSNEMYATNGLESMNGAGERGSSDRLLADVQANFDAYKTEIAIDSQRLRDDLKDAQHSAQVARTELARTKAQAEFTAERLQLLTESHSIQSTELAQASKRTADLQQTLARQEAVSHQMSESLIELRGTVDQLRHENTNLKSEREVASSVQARLVDENAALSKERAHLADLMRNLQSMQSELERSGTDARRRLEAQVIRLETQSTDLKQRLDSETDSARQLSLRKDFEAKQYQERLDKIQADYSLTREKFVEAETARTHLEQRVQDLQLQVTSREEKLAIYEGRSAAARAAVAGESTLGVTEQLEINVADLRIELEETKAKLERSNVHATELQAIADAQGGALADLQATYDAYKVSVDAQTVEKDGEITSIRERLHSLTTDLTAQSTQNSELHAQIETERVAFEKERKALEDSLAAVRFDGQAARQAQAVIQADLRQQAQKAKDAHDKYERELVAHAEDVKQLTEVKVKLEQARRSTSEAQNEASVARANLVSSEQSWSKQKLALEGELADVKTRCEDLTSQNSLLHQHLESMSAQAASLQQKTVVDGDADPAAGGADPPVSTTTSSDELHGVIKFLRREKEIVDFQLDLSKQEATRLRTQLDFASRNLEEARQALAEERQSGPGQSALSSQHEQLMERIHQAELLRESNNSLREDNRKMLKANKTLETRLIEARVQLDPLKEQVVTLQAELEARQHTVRLLEEDNERWKLRNQTILAKYERIDPEELTTLKTEVEQVKGEAEQAKKRLEEVESERATLLTQITEQTQLAESMRENWTRSQERFRALQTQARLTRDQKTAIEAELTQIKAKIESGELVPPTATTASAATTSPEAQAQVASLEIEKASLESRIRQQIETIAGLEAKITTLESERTDVSKLAEERVAALDAEKAALLAKIEYYQKREQPIFNDNKKLKQEAKEHAGQIATLQTRIEELTKLKEEFASNNTEAIEKVVQERVAAIGAQPSDATAVEELVKTKVAEVETRLTAERETAIAHGVESATTDLNKTLESVRAELTTARDAAASAAATAASAESSGDLEAANKAFEDRLAKAQSDFEASKKSMQLEFEQLKSKLAEEAKTREADITNRLTAELTQVKAEAAKAASAAAPPSTVDIDAIVKSKLEALEKGRLATQDETIKKAVEEALTRQAREKEDETNERIKKAREQVQEEADKKNQLMSTMKTKAQAQLKIAQELLKANNIEIPKPGANPSTVSTATSPAVSSSVTATPVAASGSPLRGGIRGGIRGGRRASTGRGGGAAGSTSPVAAVASSSTPASAPTGPPTLQVKSAAATAAAKASDQPKGVLGRLLGSGAVGAKRGREDDSAADGKRPKQG